MAQCAKTSGDPSRSREAWRLGTALIQAGRLGEAEALFMVKLLGKPDEAALPPVQSAAEAVVAPPSAGDLPIAVPCIGKGDGTVCTTTH